MKLRALNEVLNAIMNVGVLATLLTQRVSTNRVSAITQRSYGTSTMLIAPLLALSSRVLFETIWAHLLALRYSMFS